MTVFKNSVNPSVSLHDPSTHFVPTPVNQDHQDLSIEAAEKTFGDLRRQLTSISSAHFFQKANVDPEKSKVEESFDLLAYLRDTAEVRDKSDYKPKEMGVIFNKLGVSGSDEIKLSIPTFPALLISFFLFPILYIYQRLRSFRPTSKQILHSFSGCVKPGELCLVLGRPNSGCTTFLKVIANQRFGYHHVNGDISYGGISPAEMSKRFRGEVVYNPEEDIHHPNLTVGQTIDFALSIKTPGGLLPKTSRNDFRREVSDTLLKMLGIFHTKHTLVGDAQVRGVSGGEQKRVSIAEMMCTRACVMAWDNPTRGLDASTALQYVKSLRILANVFKVTTFVTLYQAGEGIYEQFDKVCLIDEGRQVYFGPASEARQYMINLGLKNLPRQNTADFLTGCTDVNNRQFNDHLNLFEIPKTPEELEKAYQKSKVYRKMMEESEDYKRFVEKDKTYEQEFRKAVREDHDRFISKKCPRNINFITQLRALILREIQLQLQDRQVLIFSWSSSISLAIVLGFVLMNLPETTAGAFTRGSVLFIAILFNVFLAFAELPKQMLGRPVLWRQAGFCFYRPGTLAISGALSEIPFSAIKMLVFSTILYFMTGLVRSASAFFTYYAIFYAVYFALSCFFRLLGAISSSFDIATRISSGLLMAITLYSGYVIPKRAMKRWLVWIYYINPASWGFAALMGNEFGRLELTCVGSSIIPNGDGYPIALGPNQACSFLGARPGELKVLGEDYIRASFDFSKSDVWRNFGFQIGYIFLFLFLLFFSVETLPMWGGQPAGNVFLQENTERKKLNGRLQERKRAYRSGKSEQDFSDLIKTRKPFTWENLSYDIPVPGGERRILHEIYGYVKPGTLTALMGSSGAGKTTLLDVLANRKNIGIVGGEICVAGRAPGLDFQRGIAYCEQQDVHEWTTTVREALRFSAYLRQPSDVSKKDKDQYVEQVIQLLEMEDLADAMIGTPGFGLDVEERKRVTIGVELASKPQLLLFLDEPTSGVDGQSAYNIVRLLRKLTSAGQAILCTIHQPSALLFENFDRLLLLNGGGRCVYFGEIGEESHVLRDYFAKKGTTCPENVNPAEFMLEVIGAGTGKQMGGGKDWADRWLESEEHQANIKEIQCLKKVEQKPMDGDDQADVTRATSYATSSWNQLKVVLHRTNLANHRNGNYQLTRLINHVTLALLIGLTFSNLTNNVASLQYRVFCVFFTVSSFIIAQVEPNFIMARAVHVRELSSKMYSPEIFGISQMLAEIPYSIFCSVAFFLIWYYLPGLPAESDRAGYAYFMILLLELYAVTLGQAVAALSPSIFIGSQVNPVLDMVLILFCGVLIPRSSLPKFWRGWMYNLDPFTRLISGLVTNVLHQVPITCDASEFTIFQPPSGQSCVQWAGNFSRTSGGHLDNPEATSNCRYCKYTVGDQFYENLGISFDDRWQDLGIFIAYIILNVVVVVLACRHLTLRYSKR
ncbi:ABC-2 type transporter-domain-containing protein [Melampsora americana]|nr:ABC-2 type transporter-domain-containing protein [Melampsora americana]